MASLNVDENPSDLSIDSMRISCSSIDLTDISHSSTVTSPVKGIEIGKALRWRLPDILNFGMEESTDDGKLSIDSGDIEYGFEVAPSLPFLKGVSTTNSVSASNALLNVPLKIQSTLLASTCKIAESFK